MGRRRWWFALALLAALGGGASLGGCASPPPGADGNLTNGWPTPPSLNPGLVAGQCWQTTQPHSFNLDPLAFTKVDSCTTAHGSETVFVGSFVGTAAAKSFPATAQERRPAWDQCQHPVTDFLGGDWHAARVELVLVLPSTQEWLDGRRFFRCDLVEVASERDVIVSRTASLKDGLRGEAPLARRCFNFVEVNQAIDDFTVVSCAEPHRAEFAGTYLAAEGPFPKDTDSAKLAYEPGCSEIVAKYLGMSVSDLRNHRQVWATYWGAYDTSWAIGDRAARCYVGLPATPAVRGTVRGMGNRQL